MKKENKKTTLELDASIWNEISKNVWRRGKQVYSTDGVSIRTDGH